MVAMAIAGLLNLQVSVHAQQKDIAFVVVGKTANHRQNLHGQHSLLNYHFFAEIFLKENGRLGRPALITPGGHQEMIFKGDESVLEVHGGRYQSEEALNRAFPDGNYIFSYRLSNGTLLNESVRLENKTGASRIPKPVKIVLEQGRRQVRPDAINPELDLSVSWSAFESGNADVNGIVDDLVFVVLGDCHGQKIKHSGGPFSDNEFLTYASRAYTISASLLNPGKAYQLFVEHAEIDSSIYRDIPEIATFAATTFIELHTSGERGVNQRQCPEPMPAMDGGQTDRPRAQRAGK